MNLWGYLKEKAAEVVGNQKQPTSINKIPDTQNKEIINSELQEIYSTEKSNNSENLNDNSLVGNSDILKNDVDVSEEQNNLNNVGKIESKLTSSYFGYNIFNKDPELFENSIKESISPDYIIGPGDEIILMLWGETEFTQSYIVSRDGYFVIDNLGQVFVNGLTLVKLEKNFSFIKKSIF